METKVPFSRLRLAYVLVFALYFGAWFIAQVGDDRNWIVATAGTGITGTFLPLILIAVVLLALRKRWQDLGVCIGLSVVFLTLSGQLRLPMVRAHARATPTIRIMSFNVIHGWHGIEKVANVVRDENIDAFAFQELGWGESKDAIDDLKALLPDYHIFSDGSRTSGTRLPVVRERAIGLTPGPQPWTMIEQVLQVGDDQIRVLNVHAPSYRPDLTLQKPLVNWFLRWGDISVEQTDLIERELQEIAHDPMPTVLCGDFNMTPIGRRYRLLASKGKDAFAEVVAGCGWTNPSGMPMRRIDYVWAFNGTQPLEAHTVDYRALDHVAVVATIAFH